MFAWLSTIYLDSGDLGGEKRRQAIAMLTAWPLMSTAIRPLLELTSFFAIDPRNMFCVGNEPGAVLTPEAIALNTTLKEMPGSTLSGEHERIDNGVVAVLCACARWAAVQMDALDAVPFGPPHAKKMILTRLELLSHLGEIKQQLPYRIHGGYSETLPDLTYQSTHRGARHLEEDASTVSPLFDQTLVLRLRFRGWALLPMATDPDPPTDDAGCTGTTMTHAADAHGLAPCIR